MPAVVDKGIPADAEMSNEEEKESKPDPKVVRMRHALKVHILRARERKKQEREAEVQELRLRKEREAREQQNVVMTLGEIREQIAQLEIKLGQMKDEKHQLFGELKKVLNEGDSRRKQLGKEAIDMMPVQALPTSLVHQQLYLPQPSVAARSTPIPQQAFKTAPKRPRSPSPQPAVPVSLYHQGYGYKPTTVVNTSYQTSPQKVETMRHELLRAVEMWNKTAQYNQPGFYAVPPQELQMYYPHAPITTRDAPRNIFESQRPQTYQIDPKSGHFTLRPPTTHSHVIHGGSIPLSPAQPPSTGSITAGYPIRVHKQQAAPAALYTTQSRPVYQSPGTPINYPPRE